jgi:N-acyl homoserine lactone hydrolase
MIKVYLMDGGFVMIPAYVAGKGKQGLIEGNMPYVYIEHPEAKILLDTGTNPETFHKYAKYEATDPPPKVEIEIVRSEEQKLQYYLNLLGVKPEEIDLLIPTHLHDDHIGYNFMFSNATCIVQREELRHACVPERFEDPYDINCVNILQLKYECINGDFQLFPEIEILFTPGHSAGSQSIAVHLENSGTLLFVGDAVYTREMYEIGLIPHIWWAPSMTEWARSVDRIKAYQKKTGAKIFVYHDRKDFLQNWRRFPEYYD